MLKSMYGIKREGVMSDIEQKRAERRKRLGTDQAAEIAVQVETNHIINGNPIVEQPKLFEQGAKVNGWVLTASGWEFK